MATQYKHVEIPMPHLGMNTDSFTGDPNYCQYADNVILSEPNQIRTRTGWKRVVGYGNILTSSTANHIRVLGAIIYPQTQDVSKALVNIMDPVVSGTVHQSQYQAGFGSGNAGPGTVRLSVLDLNVSTAGTRAAANSAFNSFGQVVGNSVFYNNVAYYNFFDEALGICGNAMWAGANTATVTTGGVTLNNGAVSGTFSSAPAASQVGAFLIVTGGATGPLAGYRYAYRIVSHTAGNTAFTIAEPYGMGENITNVPNAVGATTTISVRAVVESQFFIGGSTNTVTGSGCTGLFRERLFLGRSTGFGGIPGWSKSRIVWSLPGYPQKSAAQNVLELPTSEMVMGMGTINNAMLIFTQTQTYILTGYDESSFTLNLLSGEVGCIHSASIVNYKDRVYWASDKGIFYSDGGYPVELTSNGGRGIRNLYRDRTIDPNTYTPPTKVIVSSTIVGSSLVVAVHNYADSTVGRAFKCELETGAWSVWGSPGQNNGYYNPQQFLSTDTQVYAITPWQAVNISQCFVPEGLVNNSYYLNDQNYTATPSDTDTAIDSIVTFAAMRIGNDAVRVRGVQFEHNCQYLNATSSPRVAWTVYLDSDPSLQVFANNIGNIDARYVGNPSVPAFERYFTTTFRDDSVEGAVFRVSLVKTAATHSAKIYRASLLIDPQPISVSRVDTPTL